MVFGECALVPVFVPGKHLFRFFVPGEHPNVPSFRFFVPEEHPPKSPFWKPPFCEPPIFVRSEKFRGRLRTPRGGVEKEGGGKPHHDREDQKLLWRGPKIFGRARSLVTVRFPPPIRFAPPPPHITAQKIAERKFTKFFEFTSRILPRILLRIFPEFLKSFRASFRGRRRPEKNHQKAPPLFNTKFPGRFEGRIHKSFFFLESGQSNFFVG